MPDNNDTQKTTRSADSSEDGDSSTSIFSDLIERISEQPMDATDGSDTDDDSPRQHSAGNENGSTAGVGDLLPDAAVTESTSQSDNTASGTKLFYGGIVLGVVVAVVFPGVTAFTVGFVSDTFFGPPPAESVGENGTLHMSAEDVGYMNRIFRETTHEVGYCGLITTDQPPTFTVWMANTANSSAEHVSVLTDNCPEENREILIHTHPNGDLRLSEEDKRTLERRSERFICVQGGQITTEPGALVEQLACYRQATAGDASGEPTRIGVAIAASQS